MKNRENGELLLKLRELLASAEIGEKEAALILNFILSLSEEK